MIDPIQSLAFSMHSNPGVYALLLGSGVSRSAQIPTGWEITLDLIRKLAVASGESAEPSPETWFEEKYGEPPDYSKLLNELAKTPAERQQLLRPYFEPNEKEREEGAKQTTAAHRAIAQLVAKEFVKVIVTTNFDRLIEQALNEVGVVPTVISSPDQAMGALPLIHTQCCVLKVHGDYQDTRIRNTSAELDKYPEELDRILDQIFDEFGLIVCGWSADWDTALRDALYRAPSRRFTTYWALKGEASDDAQRLIDHRVAEEISIAGADGFFDTIQQNVESIEAFSRPNPLSTEVAITSLKRYMSESRFRIQLSDLLEETVKRVIERTSTQDFNMNEPYESRETVTARVLAYEAACSTLLSMAVVGGRWANEDQWSDWQRALVSLSSVRWEGSYREFWLELHRYPATLLLYALGLAAVAFDRLDFLSEMFSAPIRQSDGQTWPAVEWLPYSVVAKQDWKNLLTGMERKRAPLNDWMFKVMRQHTKSLIPDEQQYSLLFDKLEILIALGCAFHWSKSYETYFAPLGSFRWREQNRGLVLEGLIYSIRTLGDLSPYVKSGIFGETAEECMDGVRNLIAFTNKYGRYP